MKRWEFHWIYLSYMLLTHVSSIRVALLENPAWATVGGMVEAQKRRVVHASTVKETPFEGIVCLVDKTNVWGIQLTTNEYAPPLFVSNVFRFILTFSTKEGLVEGGVWRQTSCDKPQETWLRYHWKIVHHQLRSLEKAFVVKGKAAPVRCSHQHEAPGREARKVARR